MSGNSIFQRWFLPGFLFQSVVIGGGYATGRELVAFFLSVGPLGGLLGLFVAAAGFSLLMAIAFELSRMTRTYDYRTFFKQLLGRGWFLFEIAFGILALLILAVLGAASGELVSARLNIPPAVGTISLMALVGLLVFWGTSLIEKALAGWSFLLYVTYAVLIFSYLSKYGSVLPGILAADPLDQPWLFSSIKYVAYNVTAVAMIIFCVRHFESRRDAFIAGALAGPIGVLPALLFFLGMAASYPEIIDVPVPADYMMQRLAVGWLEIVFYLVVFGTFVETGSALIHSVNERIDHVFVEKGNTMPRWMRPVVALVLLFIAIVLAQRIGLVDLVAKGYGALSYAFIAIMVLPLLTVGVWRISRGRVSQGTPQKGPSGNDA
jgi:uncharacterized membrane protein YkvI